MTSAKLNLKEKKLIFKLRQLTFRLESLSTGIWDKMILMSVVKCKRPVKCAKQIEICIFFCDCLAHSHRRNHITRARSGVVKLRRLLIAALSSICYGKLMQMTRDTKTKKLQILNCVSQFPTAVAQFAS